MGGVDIAPGLTPSGGQAMMAYACCVKRRVASAGPLSEHNSAFDIRAVRDRIERDRANEEETRLMHSLRPSVARRGGEAGPAASPGPAPLPPRGEARARSPPPRRVVDDRRVEQRNQTRYLTVKGIDRGAVGRLEAVFAPGHHY